MRHFISLILSSSILYYYFSLNFENKKKVNKKKVKWSKPIKKYINYTNHQYLHLNQ